MSLAFLTAAATGSAPPAESPFAAALTAEGATFEVRGGWRVATAFPAAPAPEGGPPPPVAWADVSHLGKLEVQVGPESAAELATLAGGLELGTAVRARDAWWCLVTPVRMLVVTDAPRPTALHEELEATSGLQVLDVTTQLAALRLAGPQARETFARFCAIDIRDAHAPVCAFRPGSVARTPGYVLREAPGQFLVLTGAALAEYLWTVVSDAGRRLGGRPVGVDALSAPPARYEGAGAHA